MKAILAVQLLIFFLIGTQVWHHQLQCVRIQTASEIIMALPLSSLSEIRI